MIDHYKKSRLDTESRLLNQSLDFSGSFMAVKTLRSHIHKFPESVTHSTVDALTAVIESNRFTSQSRVLFLYRETSEALISIILAPRRDLGARIIPMMQSILLNSTSDRNRAVASALGALPLKIQNLDKAFEPNSTVTEITFGEMISNLGIVDPDGMAWFGRSLTGKTRGNRIGVIKFLRSGEDKGTLIRETLWMEHLLTMELNLTFRFDIPVPFMIDGNPLIKITHIPEQSFPEFNIHPSGYAIAFSAAFDYYRYPNETDPDNPIPAGELKEIICRTAWLLGKMASMGIVHTALIPLFHNRVQQDRRTDRGIYDWERGGRLDRWLASCRHPNFASSGIRDFEHLAFFKDSKRIHHHIGSHLLSLILVTGSYFRNLSPETKGLDKTGKPIDSRQLFDPNLFGEIIKSLTDNYHDGFAGIPKDESYHCVPNNLVHRMIQVMGVDHHMEEILRIEDQNRMDQTRFETFLETRGVTKDRPDIYQKGTREIVLQTGPHLGGFNQRISIPELIHFIFSSATLCISSRYAIENGL